MTVAEKAVAVRIIEAQPFFPSLVHFVIAQGEEDPVPGMELFQRSQNVGNEPRSRFPQIAGKNDDIRVQSVDLLDDGFQPGGREDGAEMQIRQLNDTEVFQLCREILYGNGRFPDIGNLYGIIKGNQTCCRTEQQHPERKFS